MTTLIAVRTPQGTERRCDAACHAARGPVADCQCICEGKLHGVGDSAQVSEERLDEVRRTVELGTGEAIQLRIGA